MIEKIIGLFLMMPGIISGMQALYKSIIYKDYIALLTFFAIFIVCIQFSFGIYLLLK